jgi:hypothetical protein
MQMAKAGSSVPVVGTPTLAGASLDSGNFFYHGNQYLSGLFVSPSKDKFILIDPAPNTAINYSLSSAGDLTTSSLTSTISGVASRDPQGIFVGDSGNKSFVLERLELRIWEYDNSTPYVFANVNATSYSVGTSTYVRPSPWFTSDGLTYFRFFGLSVDKYSLSAAWDLSSPTLISTTNLTGIVNSVTEVREAWLDDSGLRAFLGDGAVIEEYDLSTAFDFSTATYTGNSLSVGHDGIWVVSNKLYIAEGTDLGGSGNVFVYTLPLT